MNATKAQATPGPWLYNSHGASATEYSEGGNHHTWRWQVTTTREGGISPEELQANAALLAAAPEMAEALRLNWEHTDDTGRVFFCNCSAFGALSDDCRGDRDGRHSTGCIEGRKALRKAGAA